MRNTIWRTLCLAGTAAVLCLCGYGCGVSSSYVAGDASGGLDGLDTGGIPIDEPGGYYGADRDPGGDFDTEPVSGSHSGRVGGSGTSLNAGGAYDPDPLITIRDIAWDAPDSPAPGRCTVYLPENKEYVPFLVLAARYDDGTLLLRRDIRPLSRRINDYSSSYENCEMDRYLNGEYYQSLSAVHSLMEDTDITVTDEGALGVSGTSTRTIRRDVFLLSCTEAGFDALRNAAREGSALSYFRSPDNRIARDSSGAAASWWLRTPDTYYVSCTFGIGVDGSVGSGNAFNENGVRPALCLSPFTPVVLRDDIVPGSRVYVPVLDG